MKKKPLILGTLGVTAVFLLTGFVTRINDDYIEVVKNLEIFGKLYREVNSLYVDETDPSLLMRTGIDAMLATLDPYTNFIDEGQADEIEFLSTGQYAGIGFSLGDHDGVMTVTEVLLNSPADVAGIYVGDVVEAVNGIRVKSNLDSLRQMIKGPSGAQLDISLVRANGKREKISVKREWVKVPNVPYFGLTQDKMGYIALTGFSLGAGDEVRQAVTQLMAMNPGLPGIVLDLRDNPGGRLDEAVKVANVFIPAQETVVETRGRVEGSRQIYQTQRTPVSSDVPLVVLINKGSASASEIVAGAIQDLDRGIVLGRQSYGKGLVQNVRPLSYNTQLKVTTAKYYTPSGRCIQSVNYDAKHQEGVAIPENLRGTYYTRNRRVVYGGGGIIPDVKVEEHSAPEILTALHEKRMIFDFAAKYVSENRASLPDPQSFVVTPQLVGAFKSYLKERQFTWAGVLDQQLESLKQAASDEAYLDDFSANIASISADISAGKTQEMENHLPEISRALRLEIIRQAYHDQGVYVSALKDDRDLKEANRVLSQNETYRKTLFPVK